MMTSIPEDVQFIRLRGSIGNFAPSLDGRLVTFTRTEADNKRILALRKIFYMADHRPLVMYV
jgi:hypothetical protein